jgi:hypothetical protein
VATTSGSGSAPQSVPQPGVSGFVFFDSDGNGQWGGNESPLVDWAVELVDDFGGPIVLQRRVEPSDYVPGTPLNTVHAQATLTAIGSDVASGVVTAKTSSIFSPAGKVFAGTSALLGGSAVETWTSSSRQLRIDFANPVALVNLRAISSGPASFGRLEAYDAAGNLIDRYTTGALTSGKHELMTIAREMPDVAYVIAGGHATSSVLLDSLTWGASSAATTNILGAWGLTHLEPGTYRVKITPPGGHVVTTPASGVYTVAVGAGQAMGDLNFGLRLNNNIWHNLALAENVTGDTSGLVNVLDLMSIVNWITAQGGGGAMPAAGNPQVSGYVDVDNNGICNVLDLMAVVNRITLQFAVNGGGGAGEGELAGGAGEGGSAGGGSAGGSQGEGEESAPATAAEYYAREPVHFLEIAGADLPCCCSQCLGSTHIDDPVQPAARTTAGAPELHAHAALLAIAAEQNTMATLSGTELGEALLGKPQSQLDQSQLYAAIELIAADAALSVRSRLARR